MGHFKDLKAWQHARNLAVLSKAAIARLPDSERDGLADQWRRAAYSVALNIAEGASRRGVKDFRKHLDIARASLHEIEAILDLVLALEYFRLDELAQVQATRDECAKSSPTVRSSLAAKVCQPLAACGSRLAAGSCRVRQCIVPSPHTRSTACIPTTGRSANSSARIPSAIRS